MENISPKDLNEFSGGYAVFQNRAMAFSKVENYTWLVGFESGARDGFEKVIADSICKYLDLFQISPKINGKLIDIGAGSSNLTEEISKIADDFSMKHYVIDSPEMLAHLQDSPSRFKLEGQFPINVPGLDEAASGADVFLAYSVLQYVYKDGIENDFFETLFLLMKPGSLAIIGDVPNSDTRNRKRIASGLDSEHSEFRPISDESIHQIMEAAHEKNLEFFIFRQDAKLPLSSHRLDILIYKPKEYSDNLKS